METNYFACAVSGAHQPSVQLISDLSSVRMTTCQKQHLPLKDKPHALFVLVTRPTSHVERMWKTVNRKCAV